MRVSRHTNALMRREAVRLTCEGRWRCARCQLSQEIKGAYPYVMRTILPFAHFEIAFQNWQFDFELAV